MNLFEAFDKLKTLDEETFDVSKEGIEKLKEFKDDDYTDELIDIYDADYEDNDSCDCECHDHKEDVILDCSVCHSKVYKDKKDVKLDEDADLANVGDECPYCHSNDGYKVVGQVKECDMREGKEDVCPKCKKPLDKCVCKDVNEAFYGKVKDYVDDSPEEAMKKEFLESDGTFKATMLDNFILDNWKSFGEDICDKFLWYLALAASQLPSESLGTAAKAIKGILKEDTYIYVANTVLKDYGTGDEDSEEYSGMESEYDSYDEFLDDAMQNGYVLRNFLKYLIHNYNVGRKIYLTAVDAILGKYSGRIDNYDIEYFFNEDFKKYQDQFFEWLGGMNESLKLRKGSRIRKKDESLKDDYKTATKFYDDSPEEAMKKEFLESDGTFKATMLDNFILDNWKSFGEDICDKFLWYLALAASQLPSESLGTAAKAIKGILKEDTYIYVANTVLKDYGTGDEDSEEYSGMESEYDSYDEFLDDAMQNGYVLRNFLKYLIHNYNVGRKIYLTAVDAILGKYSGRIDNYDIEYFFNEDFKKYQDQFFEWLGGMNESLKLRKGSRIRKKDESLKDDYKTATKFYDAASDYTISFLDAMQAFMDTYNDYGYKPNLKSFISYMSGGFGEGSEYEPIEESLKENNLGQDVEKYQRWVDYDMKKYKKVSDQTNRKIKEAGLQLVKDQYGDYEVTAGNDSISESRKRRLVKEAGLEDPEEVIEPVSPKTEMEIEGDFDEPVEETDFDEESFDEVAESYLKKINENVTSYKTRRVFTNKKNNRLVIEGIIRGKDISRKATRFIFESTKPLTSRKLVMIGLNESLAKGNTKPYRLFVKNTGKKIVVEGLRYRHTQKSKIGKTTMVEGFVKKGKQL